MSEIVKAVLGVEECLMMGIRQLEDLSPGERVPVLILPIEDGKVGPFERPKWRNTDARNITTEEGWIAMPRADYDKIRAAISRLFEEVGSGD